MSSWLELLQQRHAWLDQPGPSSDVVISSRVRLARNLVGIPFPARLGHEGQRALMEKVRGAVLSTTAMKKAQFIDLSALKKFERQFLMERHMISPEMVFEDTERGVVIGEGQDLTLLINEEDHLRLQSFGAGLSLRKAWVRADGLDTDLGQKLPFAFDSEWGYCTRCPTNAGTGMRASCLIHVPALVMNGSLDRVLEGLARSGVVARGLYGERSKAIGDLFQISNSVSLGETELEIADTIERVVHSIVQYEKQAQMTLLDPKRKTETEDNVFRSWGILLHARAISYDEAMDLLSRVRLGLQLHFKIPVEAAVLNELMILTQPAHLQIFKGGSLKAEERDRLRAELIRQKLTSGHSSDPSNPRGNPNV